MLIAFVAVAVLTVRLSSGAATLVDPCSSPGWNVITCENSKPGTPQSTWGAGGAGDSTLQGFSTDISVDHGQTVSFKITDTNGSTGVGGAFHIDIYRVGYYQGNGARLQATIPSTSITKTNQAACLTEATTGLIDCGNWTVSATWAVPATAVSGLYFANLVRDTNNANSHIYFVVRDDERHAPILAQTSDETWEAYNAYGGNSLYVGTAPTSNGRAYKVSYNRPLTTGNNSPRNEPLYAEYPMIRFLEKNGYDVSYFSDVDAARSGAEIVNHKTFMSVGHDEYWSAEQRNNVVAARNAGVNLAFFSGNEIFWKTRFAASISTGAQAWRTVVCYKESKESTVPIDPADPPTSTGAWRDPRFASADGSKPENAVSGQIYMVDAVRDDAIAVPYAYSQLRFWNNTSIAHLAPGQTATLPTGTLGYEWDEDLDNGSRPAGLIDMSSVTVPVSTLVTDSTGQAEGSGSATHHLTLYRASSGALVFGAGTVQWSFGLDDQHTVVTGSSDPAPSVDMQQATVNLLADMGVQPATLQSGLVTASKSSDSTPPTSAITYPTSTTLLNPTQSVTVTGTASDTGGGVVAGVEVSTDGGATWHPATGTTSWSYTFVPGAFGQITIESRATDDSANIQTSPATVTVSVGACPCNIFGTTTPANPSVADPNPYELGVKFRSDVAGFVSGIRFYKGAGNTGTHTGHLWTSAGSLLGTATFTGETSTGWQQVNFASPIAISANTTYVASYFTQAGNYAADRSFFTSHSVDVPPLHALADGTDGANGVYASGGGFPTSSFQASNYYVDIVFTTSNPPVINAVTPAANATGIATSTAVTATFSQPMDSTTLTTSTVTLRDSSNTLVPATVTYDGPSMTATLTPSQPLALSTTYTATIKGGSSGVKSTNGTGFASDYTWTFTTATPAPCPCTIFPASATPTITSSFDTTANELGVKFRSDEAGYIRGIRFYKGPGNTGTHIGHLWSSTGAMLAEITFTNETAGGWQQVDFPRPVAINANTTYIASYFAPNGGYALDRGYFTTGVDRSPLHALADGVSGPDGVFASGGGFPSQGSGQSNYWVDAVFDTNGNDTTPPIVSSVSPTNGATAIATSRAASVTFNESMDPLSITTTNVQLRDPSNALIPATISYDAGTNRAILTPSSPLALSTTYTLTVKGGPGGVTDASGNALAANFTSTFVTGTPAACPCNLLDSNTPTVASTTDTSPTEVGLKFRSDVDGYVTGIRFYKGLQNTGTHVGHLWSSSGIMMASATFTNETSSGWQQASFSSPVAIRANTTYLVSYFAPNGGYALDRPYFSNWLDRPPLHALAEGVEGSNGVYAAGTGFPTQAFDSSASNYWVDPVFDTSNDRTPPTVTSTSPAANATGIFRNTTVSAVFSEALDPSSISSSDFVLQDGTGALVAATVSYNAATTTATLTPNAPLTAGMTYTATVSGGAAGVKDLSGNALSSDYNWSFTISNDTTAPTTTIGCNSGGCANWFGTSPVTVSLSATDNPGGSGVDTTKYTIDGTNPNTSSSAALYAGPFTVTTTTTVRYASADKAGNVETPGTAQIRIDTTAPSAPSLSFGSFSNASAAGSTVYFNPAAAGGFTVTGSSSDGESGIASINYPSLGSGWSAAGGAYTFSAGASDPVEPNNVTATNNAGLTSTPTSFTVTADGTAPSTVATCNGGACPAWSTTSPVTVALNATDTGSGVAATYYTTDGSIPSAVHGSLYLGAFTVGVTTTVKFRSYDNVGNVEAVGAQPVQIDTTPPSAPSLSFSGLAGAALAGGVLYFNPSAAGGFTVTPSSTDAESGVATYSYPSLGSGWSVSGSGAYAFAAGAADPVEPNNVTATNNAGLTSAPTSFTVTADSSAPATTASCNGAACTGWYTAGPVSLTLNATDTGSGVARILYSTDGNPPSTQYTGAISIAATTTVKFAAVDKVGNTEATKSLLVQVDTTPPSTPSLALGGLTSGTAITGGVLYYNPSASGGFTVAASSTDAESGIASYSYPSLGTGWHVTGGGAYTFDAGAADPAEPNNVTAMNNAGLTSAPASFTVNADATAPTTSATCNGGPCAGWYTTTPVTLALTSTDGGSGVDRILYSTDGTAPSLLYTSPLALTSSKTVKYAAYDRVGNLEATKTLLVQVDTTPPSAPSLTLGAVSGATTLNGGVLYFNPGSSGGFTVTASSADAESGVASYSYPSLGSGWGGGGGAYTFSAGATDPAEPNNVTATNNAGLISAPTSFTVTADSTAPATTATCNGGSCAGWFTTSPVSLTLNAADSGSGVARILYSTDGSAPSTQYTGAIGISATTTVKFAAVDKVGNTEATRSVTVQVDTTAPSAPSLTLGATGSAAVTSGTLYFNPAGTGAVTVAASSTDAESGVATYNYPSLGSGWTSTGSGYTFAAGATDPVEPNNVTATNNAGLTSTPTSFTVTADSTRPATTAACNGGSCVGWFTSVPVSLSLSAADTGSGVKRILYSTDGSAPSLVYSGAIAISGTTTVTYQAVDNVGNVETPHSTLVQVDTTAPSTPTLAFSALAGAAVTGSTVYYGPAAGNFTVTASSSDAESGIATYAYPSFGPGWSNTGGAYSFSAGAPAPAPANVTATNNAGLTSAPATFNAVLDGTAPTTSIACTGGCTGWHTTSPVTVTLSASDGSGSGIDRILYSTDGSAPSLLYTAPFTVAATSTVKFAAYDRVGNLETAKSQLVQIDTTAPSAPSLAFGGLSGAAVTAGVLYFNPAAPGGFTVTPSSTDAESGVASYAYPSLGSGWTNSNGAYTFAAGASDPVEPNNITATNNAGLTSSATSFTVTADTTAPATTAACNGNPCAGWYTSAPVSVALSAADGGSGVARILYSTDGNAPTTLYTGPISIAATTTVKYAAVDNVGNTEATKSQLVQVDTTAPSAPALSFSGFGGAALVGGVLYFNPTAAGGFTVTPSSSDAQSGIDHYGYPSLGAGWANSDGSYAFSAGAADPVEPNNVTATNGAGLTSAPTSFTVTADTTAPATSATCNANPCTGWYATAPVTVALSATDGGSGVDRILYSTDGSAPSTVYTGPLSISTTTTVKYVAVDKVGNTAAVASALVQIDTTAPSTPVLSLSETSPFESITSSTLFYNPSGTNSGTFGVAAATGDAESGIQKVTFPAIAGLTGGGDVGSSPYQTSYSWTATATASGTQTVTARNNAGLTASATFTLTPDTSAPTGGSISYVDGYVTTGSVTITTANGSDGGAGIDTTSGVLQRDAIGLTNGTCGTFAGNWTAATSPDTTLVSGTCYRYRYLISDKVGNTATYTSASVVKADSSAPSAPALTLSSSSGTQFITGSTIYYGTSSNGNFTVTATATDAESGIKQLNFPSITGFSGGGADTTSPYTATYGWTSSTSASGAQNVTATNNASLTGASTPFTVTPDNTAPTLALTAPVANARIRNGVVLTPSVSDTGSGVKSVEYRYCSGTGNCQFSSATTISGALVSTTPYTFTWNGQPADGTYQIVARATDNVGNVTILQSGAAVQVTIDNTPPFTAVSLVGATGAYLNGGTLYMANTAGSFSLHVDVLDPQPASGVKNVVFPAITNTGWTGPAVTDTTLPYEAPYSFGAGAAVPGAKTIVTSDNAGNTQSDTITFAKDQTAPTVTLTAPAGGTRLANGATVSATASDGGSGIRQVDFRYCPGTTCTFASGTAIGTATSAPFTVAWNSQPADGTYTIAVQATDNVGNTATDGTATVTIDNSAPTTTLSVVSGAHADLQYFAAGTLYYNPAATGDFTLSETATDPAGVASVAFPAIAQTGFNGTAKSAATGPYVSNTYTFDASNATPPPPATVLATDGVGNQRSDSVVFVRDTTGPAGGSVSYPDGYAAGGTVTIATSTGIDSGAGVNLVSGVLERQTATLSGGTCGTFGAWLPAASPDTLPSGTCAQYRYRISDRVGNQSVYASTNVVKSDTSAPSAPALTFGSFTGASATGSTVYFNPAATGGFTVGATSTDGESGVASYGFPGLGSGWTNSGGAYSFTPGASDPVEPNTVTATNNAGLTSSGTSFTVTADSSAPATTATCNGGSCAGWFTSSPVSVTLTATDGGAGVDHIVYSTDGSAPSTVYSGPISIAATTTVEFAAVDKVGNVEATESQLVQVDTTAPSAPSLTFGGLSGSTALAGGTLYFNPAGSGGFSVTPSSTDAESGVASYGYPALGSGWSGSGGTYTFGAGATDPAEPNTVTATNRAGLTSAGTSFTVSADASAPTTTIACTGGCAGWHTTSPTVSLSAVDGGAGVAGIVYSIDGSAPSVPYTGPFTLSATATVQYAATDNVGNVEATRSQLVQVDTTAPSAPALTLSPVAGTAVTGSTVFYNPAATGSFTVGASSADAESGVASYGYPSLGLGWTTTGPGAYSFAAGALSPGTANVTATNNAGLTSAPTSFTVTADTTAPSTTASCNGGACAGWFTHTPVSFSLSSSDGGGSGLDRILYSTDGSAPSLLYTAPLTLTSTTTVTYAAYDRVGNLEAAKSQLVQIDTTAPSAPSLAFGGLSSAALTNGVLYFNPSTSGGFTVTPSSADAESGISSYSYPSLGSGWTNSDGAYSFSAGAADPAEPNNVTATNNAGLTSAATSFTVTADATAPSATIACDGTSCAGWHTTSPVTVALSATDGGSGVDHILYSTDGNAPSTPYTGPFTLAATATVRFTAIDKVGNATPVASTPVQIDTTAPTTPSLTFSALTNASASGSTVYYRSSTPGGFTVNAASGDPESGVATYGYPSLGTGWTNTGGAYSFAAGAPQPLASTSVTATNNAGLTSAPAPFSVVRDDTAPVTTIHCNGGTCGSGFASSSVLVSLASNDGTGSGVVQTLYTLDGTDPSPLHGTVYLGGFTLSSTATVRFRSYDAVGNEEAVGSQLVNVDTTPPSAPALSISAPASFEYATGTTLYYNPSGTNTGSFTVSATASDADSGIAKIHFPTILGIAGGGDTTTPFSSTYTWGSTATAFGNQTVTAYNGSGLTSTSAFTLVPDTTAPAGGSISYPDGFQSSSAVTITTTDGTDGGAGIDSASRTLERQTAPLANGTCGTWSAWTTVTSPDTVGDATCARYRYRVSDRVGNQQIYTSANVVKVDAGAPSTPSLTLTGSSPNEFITGTTLYYNPSGSNTGSFTVSATTSAASGIAKVSFPALTGLSGGGDVPSSPYASTYGWTNASTATGTQTVTAKSNAGGTSSATFTVTPDTGAPTGQSAAIVGGPWFTTTSISVTTANGNDAISGLDASSGVLQRDAIALTNGTCGTFLGNWTTVSSPDTTVTSGNCYRYRYSIADKVGNRSTPVMTAVAMVDTTPPTAPALSFGALDHASVTGSTVFYNSNSPGSFTVGASSSDPQSGIASYAFPAFGSGWTGTNGAYTFATGAADPTEPNNVTSTDAAGLTSSATGFTVTADGDAPTGGSVGYTDGYRTSASVAISLSNGSDALSGVDPSSAILQRATATLTDGSCAALGSWNTIATVPTLSYTDTGVTSGNCYAYRYLVADKVGNIATFTSTAVAKIDTNAPTGSLDDPGASLRGTVNLTSVSGDTGGSGVATVVYQRSDPSGWVTIPQAWDTTTVGDGLYDLRIVVTDRAGNSTTSAVVAGRRVDNTPPTATLSDPGANLRGLVNLASTSSDGGSGVATVTYQRSDPSGWVTIPQAWDTTTVGDGLYDLRVVVVDVAGNQTVVTVTGRRVDNTAPSAAMVALGSVIRGTVTLGSSVTDGGSGVSTVAYERQQVGTTGWVATPAIFDTTGVPDGDYDIHVVATDAAGNSTTSASVRTHIDNTSPRPTAVSPADGSSSVATGAVVTATFPRAMLATSLTSSSFTLTSSAGPVPAAVSYNATSLTATLTPNAALAENTSYTATLTTAVTAQDGATLYQAYSWTFSTGAMPPAVTAKTPSNGATGVALTVAPTATFSKPMNAATINGTTATLSSSSGNVAATVSYDSSSRTVTITPNAALAYGTTYTVQLSSGITSQDGLALSPVSWTFTTVAGAPNVSSTSPASGATGVATATAVSATFDRDMNAASLTGSTFTLTGPSGSVAATVAYSSATRTATLTPTAPLASGTTYTATVSGSVQSSGGVAMGSPSTWTFTTTTGPEVRSTTPANGATGVSMSAVLTLQMSMAIDSATVTSTNIKVVRPDTSNLTIALSYNSTTHVITITPSSPFEYSATYTIQVGTGITAGGIPMAAPFTSTFTTTGTGIPTRVDAGSTTAYTATNGNVFAADTGFIGGTARTVTNTITGTTDPTLYKTERYGTWQYSIPVPNGYYDVKLHFVELTNTACNQRVFSVDILNTALVNDVSNLDIFCEVGANKPDIKTFTNVLVNARVLRLKAVAGTVGTPEIAAVEITPHQATASALSPASGATGVSVGTAVSATFSQAMDATSLTPSTVTLSGPSGAVPATVTYNSATNTVTLTPNAPLAHATAYTARLDATIRDAYGMTIGAPTTWTFTTG